MVKKMVVWLLEKAGIIKSFEEFKKKFEKVEERLGVVELKVFAEFEDKFKFQTRKCEELDDKIKFQTRKCKELDGVVCELMDEIKELRAELEALRRPPVYKASEINSGLFGEIMDEFINGPQIKNREDD